MTKINDIHYKKLELQKYLESCQIFTHRKKLLFKIRTKMVNVNYNYGKKIKCPLCQTDEDTQVHLTKCSILKDSLPDIYTSDIDLKDAFDVDVEKADKLAKNVEKILQRRAELLDINDTN